MAITVAGLSGVLAWMLLRPSVIAPRYILASLLLLVPILTIAVEDVLAQKAASQVLRAGTTLTVLFAIAASFWHLLPIPGAIISGFDSKGDACSLAGPECDSFQILSEIVRPGDRILIASYYPYWLTPAQLQCRDTLDEQQAIPDQVQLVPWLQSRGFTYVAVDSAVSRKLAADLTQLAESNASDVYELPGGTTVKLYHIKSDRPGRVSCVETTPGRWSLRRDSL